MEKIIMNDVVKAILDRRSVRKYSDKQLTNEELETLLCCGFNAPSGGNSQSWFITVMQDKAKLDEINAGFVANMLKGDVPDRVRENLTKKDYSFYFNAPTVLWVSYPKDGPETNASLLGENIVIAAQSLELGTCYLGGVIGFLRKPEAEDLRKMMGIEDKDQLLFGIAVGYPTEAPDAKPRDLGKFRVI